MRALREAADQPDSYFSSSAAAALLPPTTDAPEPAAVPKSTGNADVSSVSPSPYSPPLHPQVDIPRGRSTVRTSSNIEIRERSSSKGSSPIGSVSPTPSRTGSTAHKVSIGPVYVGMNRELLSRDSTISTTHVDVYKLPSRIVDFNRPDATFPGPPPTQSVSSPDLTLPRDGTRQVDGLVRNDQFKIAADLVPVLPSSDLVNAVKLNGDASGSVGGGGTMAPSKASRAPSQFDSRLTEDVDAVDGSDGYLYHSTNPTPTNSPTLTMKSLPAGSTAQPSIVPEQGSRPLIPSFDKRHLPPSSSNHSSGNRRSISPSAPRNVGGYIEEGTLVARAADIVSSARGLFGAIWGAPASSVEPCPPVNGRRASDG